MSDLFPAAQEALKTISTSLLDALFPPHCAGCDEWRREVFCPFCLPKLRPIGAPLCDRCGAPFDPLAYAAPICAECRAKPPHFLAARSAYHFDGPIRESIHRLKYREKKALAPRLAPLLAKAIAGDKVLATFAPHFLVPVPLHSSRLRQRGFNQSFLLAFELGRQMGVPAGEMLNRTRRTPPQVELNRADRLKNVRGAFEVDNAAFARYGARGARILLIDDVFTTGATLGESARALQKAGAGEICALTLGRQA
jgi:ComF family protein